MRMLEGRTEPPREAGTRRSIRRHLLVIGGTAVALILGITALGAGTELSGAVVATGSLVVETNVKKVQHPTGGPVGQLLVDENSHVKAGDLLLRLDATAAQANLAMVTKSLYELAARRGRLEAERDGQETVRFEAELTEAASDPEIARIVAGERRLFGLRQAALKGQKDELSERIGQLRNEITGLADQLSAKDQELALVQKELAGVRELWEKNLIQITRLTAMEREAARLKGERGQLVARTAQTKGKITETELQILDLDQTRRTEVAKELSDIRAKSAELAERKITAADQLRRVDIRAPQSGFVHELAVHGPGAVVGPGEQIMTIVPDQDRLVVEVRVMPQDIDQVHTGQPAAIRFPTFNQRTTPELNGIVRRVSADVSEDERSASSYYVVRVALPHAEIERLGDQKLVPGMPVDAFIRTSERTMLSYLLKPLGDQARRAFREK